MIWIKNIDTVSNTYSGQAIVAGAYYEIKQREQNDMANNSSLLIDICNDKAQISPTSSDGDLIVDHSEQIDFLKSFALVKTQNILSQDGLTSRPFGFSFTALKGITTTFNYKLLEAISIRGGTLETDKMVFGDCFSVKVVDIDGVVYPAGTVLFDFIKDWQCQKDGFNELKEETITKIIPADVYVEVKYKSIGTVDDVEVGMNMFGYK